MSTASDTDALFNSNEIWAVWVTESRPTLFDLGLVTARNDLLYMWVDG